MDNSQEICIETSSLKSILDDRSKAKSLVAKIQDQNQYFLIPVTALDEIFEDPNQPRAVERSKQLIQVWENLGDLKIRLTYFQDIHRVEFLKKRKKTPLVSSNKKRNTKDLLTNIRKYNRLPNGWTEEFKEKQYQKEGFVDLDEEAREKRKEFPGTDEEILQHVVNYPGPREDNMDLEIMYKRFKKDLTLPAPKAVIADRERYHSIRVLISLNEINRYGNLLSPDNGHPVAQMLRGGKRGKGNYLDNYIACCAAYSTYFIVDDKSCREKCEHLRKLGFLKFKSVQLNEFSGA